MVRVRSAWGCLGGTTLAALIAFSLLLAWVHSHTTYDLEAYRPKEVVARGDPRELQCFHTIDPTLRWPITLYTADVDIGMHVFDQAFAFSFDEGEKVISTIHLEVHTNRGVHRDTMELEWCPICYQR